MVDSIDGGGLASAEDRLQDAVRRNDADAIGDLLRDDLIAVAPDGQLVDKKTDIDGYASGAFRVEGFDEIERRVVVVATTGVTLILARVVGTQGTTSFDVTMRYTRTWTYDQESWRILAAHLTQIQP